MATRGRASSVQATHDCTSALKNLANAVARIRKGVKVLGTPKDTLTFREKMMEEMRAAQSLLDQISAGMAGLRSQPLTDPKHLKVLERSYATVQSQLGKISSAFKTKARQHAVVDDGSGSGAASTAAGMSTFGTSFDQSGTRRGAQQAQATSESKQGDVIIEMKGFGEVDMAILEERNRDAQAIAEESAQLKETFQDLAVLVQEQHEQLQEVDANVSTSVQKVQKGNEYLEEATTLQAAERRKRCCILAIVVLVLLAIVIPVVLTQVKKG